MKKFINDPKCFVDETMEGIFVAYPQQVKPLNGDLRVLVRATPSRKGKVGIVTAGGSGHLPTFLGYVGEGLLDGCAVGNVFASPSAGKMADMIRACDEGSGVLCLYGNYGGDNMNFDMACDDVTFDDIQTRTLRVKDDIASASIDEADKRRGVAGMVYAFKIAGALADQGCSLDEVTEGTARALENIRTLGFATNPCILPEVGSPSFSIAEDEIEIGMGIHGEPGIEISKMKSADEVAEIALRTIEKELILGEGDEVSVMVNSLGATPKEELLIVFRRLNQLLTEKGVSIVQPHIGEYATSMEMMGLSITIFKLDGGQKVLLQAPARSPFYTNSNL